MQSPGGRIEIPVEIWQQCFSNLSTSGLVTFNLSTTCRLFHDICRPQIFENLVCLEYMSDISETYTEENFRELEKRVTRFEGKFKWLASDPIRAQWYPWICMFIVEGDGRHSNSKSGQAYRSLLFTFKVSLGSFTNIRQVRLINIELDEEIMEAISRISRLEQIYLNAVEFKPPITSPLVHLTEPHISESGPQIPTTPVIMAHPPPRLSSIQGLKSVEIQSYRYSSPILRGLLSQGTSEALTKLHIVLDVGVIPTFLAFLETCPRLTTLVAVVDKDLVPLNFNNPAYPSLSSSALPNLRCYTGMASLAAVLVPGRPVHNITIEDSWDVNVSNTRLSSILHELTKSSVTVRALSLPELMPHPDILHTVSAKFPRLESLKLHFCMPNADRSDINNINDDVSVPDEEYFNVTTPTEIKISNPSQSMKTDVLSSPRQP